MKLILKYKNFFQENASGNIVCEMVAILPEGVGVALVKRIYAQMNWAKNWSRPGNNKGVARRRPRGPGLNLKMQKKKNPKFQIHVYMKYNTVILNICLLYWPPSKALIQNISYSTYLFLHIHIWYFVTNCLNDHLSLSLLVWVGCSWSRTGTYGHIEEVPA